MKLCEYGEIVKEGRISWNKGLTKETDERVRKQSDKQKGKRKSEEHKRNISKAQQGKRKSEESNERRRQTMLKHWKNPPWNEKERNEKISKAQLGKSCTWLKGNNNPSKRSEVIEKLRKKTLEQFKNGMPERTKEKLRHARLNQVLPVKDTSIEKIIQKALKKENIKFRTHKPIKGQPDIFIEPNICIFADGDYWHASPNLYSSEDLVSFPGKKIQAKAIWRKDEKVTKHLEKRGYRVLRFWENEINSDLNCCIKKIKHEVYK